MTISYTLPTAQTAPRVRLLKESVVNSTLYSAGVEIDLRDWPRPVGNFEAVNAKGEAVLNWMRRHAHLSHLPPLRDGSGSYYLGPVYVGWAPRDFPFSVGPAAENEPLYRVRSVIDGLKASVGEIVAYRYWPVAKAMVALEVHNEIAENVRRYYAAYSEHPDLPAAPWNDYPGSGLHLPKLRKWERSPGPGSPPHSFQPVELIAHGESEIEGRTFHPMVRVVRHAGVR